MTINDVAAAQWIAAFGLGLASACLELGSSDQLQPGQPQPQAAQALQSSTTTVIKRLEGTGWIFRTRALRLRLATRVRDTSVTSRNPVAQAW